ncbi:MAG: glycosyltransferase family 39 protein [Bacteroidetes bacterium]|nr:glycosyltransferase family 39 protein [Bacteroidota bacterium]
MKQSVGKSDNIILFLILLLGAGLRFYGFADFSLSNDELSALNRLQYDTFGELIEKGVKIDGHPPLVQVFLYYWTKIFGFSEVSVRLPFIVCGIISIYFLYCIGSFWFNPATGLLAAAALASLEYPLMYTQIARPYSPGLLFTLMNTWFWTKLLFDKDSPKFRTAVFYGITGSLCMATHYFSFLSALITGLTGLFFLRRSIFKYYMIGGGISFLLFIPALGVFYHQFFEIGGLGGPTGWLGKPKPDFFRKFLFECFNNSKLLTFLVTFASLTSLAVYLKEIRFSRFHFLCILWFLLPYFIGYYYSIYRSAVLQDKLLLFSFPFLLLFLFSFFRDGKKRIVKTGIIICAMGVFVISTVVINRYFSTQHFDQFNTVARKTVEYIDRYGEQNIVKTVNVHGPYYINYYLNRLGRKVDYISYRNDAQESFLRFDSICRNSSAAYFLYSWASTFSPCEIIQVIKEYYPFTVHKELYNRSEIYLFGRKEPPGYVTDTPFFVSLNDFESGPENWSRDDSALTGRYFWSGVKSAKVNSKYPYSPTFSAQAHKILHSVDDIIYAGVRFRMENIRADVKICIAFEENNKVYEWHDMALNRFSDSAGVWKNAYIHSRVPELKSKNDIIKIFVWSIDGSEVFLDDFKVWVEKGNTILYGRRLDHDILE